MNSVTVVDVYDLCTGENTGGWARHSVNLSAYRGQSVFLEIRAETDSNSLSNLFVDDVSLQASAAREATEPAGDDQTEPMSKSGRLAPRTAAVPSLGKGAAPGNVSRLFYR